MTKTFKRIIIAAIVFILIAAAAVFAVVGGCSASAKNTVEDVRNNAVNTLIDSTGIKQRLESELRNHTEAIAEQTGIPEPVITNAIDSLDIQDWEVTTLPASARETGTFAIDTGEVAGNVVTYDDPSIISVDAYGQTLTLSVPESAQAYVSMLGYLS